MRLSRGLPALLSLLALLASGCNGDGFSHDAKVTDSAIGSDADAGVTPGDEQILLLKGTVVTPDQVLAPGEVLTHQDTIVCVAASCASDPLAAKATVVDTAGIIYPGLVDAHNHTEYNYLPLWKHPKLYSNHNQWQASTAYKTAVSGPHGGLKDPGGTDGTGACSVDADCSTGICAAGGECESLECEMIKYGEIRSLIAGTTMIQGTAYRKCADTLIRNADLPYHGLSGGDSMRTNILGISQVDAADAQKLRDGFTGGTIRSYVIHLAEGIDETARKEWDQLEALDLLKPQVVVIHGTALGQVELEKMKQASMPMIWSPSSNLDLYGDTNDIVTAKTLGLLIALSPDWTPSGAPNILDELKTADELNRTKLGNLWSAKELVQMVTTRAAAALKFEGEIGALKKGLRADLLVLTGDASKPYEALIQAQLSQVRLVVVRGRALYGDPTLMSKLAPNEYCETLNVCSKPRVICVKERETSDQKLDQSLGDIIGRLGQAYPQILPLSTCK